MNDSEPRAGTAPLAADEPATAANRLAAVRRRLHTACERAQRSPASVKLLAVSKTWPAERVLELAALGQREFAENYLQEAIEKIRACDSALRQAREETAIAPSPPARAMPIAASSNAASSIAGSSMSGNPELIWHFIGPIQSNKTRPIAEHFDWVHAIERDKIARRLSEQRPADRPALQVCIQVNVSGETSKSGCAPDEALALALDVARLPRLRLRGLMAIPEASSDPRILRDRFASLNRLATTVRAALAAADPTGSLARDFNTLSMGMSDDLEDAIAEGATIVRIGTALFGKRSLHTGSIQSPDGKPQGG